MDYLEKVKRDEMLEYLTNEKAAVLSTHGPDGMIDAGQYVIMQVTPTWLRYGVFLNEQPKGEYFTQFIPPKE